MYKIKRRNMAIVYGVSINHGKGNNSAGKWTENKKTYFMKKIQLANSIYIKICNTSWIVG